MKIVLNAATEIQTRDFKVRKQVTSDRLLGYLATTFDTRVLPI
jgi:hypothetical protein